MRNRLFQELCADGRPPVGPIGTPCGNGIWVIIYLVQEYHWKASIWYCPGELLLAYLLGPTEPAASDGTMQIV
jgi:hypothetical protein